MTRVIQILDYACETGVDNRCTIAKHFPSALPMLSPAYLDLKKEKSVINPDSDE
jgi:hypothetical protein